MMSGIATIVFLLIVQGKVPSYLGTSAAFVGGVAAIRANGGDSAEVTGAILVAGLVLALVGVAIHFLGSSVLHQVLPPVVTGAVVMLIGFNLAPVVAASTGPRTSGSRSRRWSFTIVLAVAFRGLHQPHRGLPRPDLRHRPVVAARRRRRAHHLGPRRCHRGDHALPLEPHPPWARRAWFGFPTRRRSPPTARRPSAGTRPSFSVAAILLVLPAVIALIAENTGHVKAVAEMTGHDLDPVMGRAIAADGIGALASSVGGSPTTTYAENIGVMAATRVYSTAAYWVAAGVAILFGLSPKFGALVASVPGGVLGGITVVLYGMIGLLGAKIWRENGVDFGNPINLVPIAAGIIIGIGNVKMVLSDNFSLEGIALGTIVTIAGYHLARRSPRPRSGDRAGGGHRGGRLRLR